jgi:UDP-N-acetylmuramoyl-tripeptide--D-alanyl-D-alanine ligase
MKSFFKKIIVAILTWEAKTAIRIHKPRIIAITGTVGKTSTKDALFVVVNSQFDTWKSQKSFNSEIGVPLTILNLQNGWSNPFLWLANIFKGFVYCLPKSLVPFVKFPQWLVLEVGADHPHDIENLTKWLKPEAVVLTRLSDVPVHVEFFDSIEQLFKEKAFLVRSLKDGGRLFLNADDKDVMEMKDERRGCHVVTYGIVEPADFQASNIEIAYDESDTGSVPVGMTFKVNHSGSSVPIKLNGIFGRQHVYPVLAGFAFGESLGINLVKIIESFSNYKGPLGRMNIIKGVKNTTIIDDTYNSSPVAVSEALKTLKDIKTDGRKVAVLGDMLELGKYSVQAHKKAGKEVAGVADILVTVGLRARDIAMGALDNEMDENNIFQFDDSIESGKFVESIIKEGDVILVKGSQGIRAEKIVEEIMLHPEQKESLLVRQEEAWQNR